MKQINLNRCRAAQDLLCAVAKQKGVGVLIVSEPNKEMVAKSRPGWYADANRDAAIAILNREIYVHRSGSGRGFVWVELDELIIFSCYFSPNAGVAELNNSLEELGRAMRANRRGRREVIVAGDFNGWSPEWGMDRTNERGTVVSEWIAREDLHILNDGTAYTFVRGDTGSILDLTLGSEGAARRITGWRVLTAEETLSDHLYITYDIGQNRATQVAKGRGWKLGRLNKEAFQRSLAESFRETVTGTEEALTDAVIRACDTAMPRKGSRKLRKEIYWWTEEIAALRRECIATRRQGTRQNRRAEAPRDNPYLEEYRNARRNLREAIKRSKRERWRELCECVDMDVWGDGYKIATRQMRNPPPVLPAEKVAEVVNALFPERDIVRWRVVEVAVVPSFTEEELEAACARLKSGKAAGLDEIPPEIVKLVTEEYPEVILRVVNRALERGDFPSRWRKARVVLIQKGGKPPEEPSSYRPLCLLNAMGKLLEYLILERLEKEIDEKGGLSESQFGFRKGRSTVGAIRLLKQTAEEALAAKSICAVVTLDIKNAFNTAGWAMIVRKMESMGIAPYLVRITMSYFQDRMIGYETEGEIVWKNITCGVPQGSVLGPTLWNIMFDDVFRLQWQQGVKVIGYADDLAITVTGRWTVQITEAANETIRKIERWLARMQLELAAEKTEFLVITRKRNLRPMKVRVGRVEIRASNHLKYLGVWLDSKLNFGVHATKTAEKAGKAATAIGRLMANTYGPRASKRRLMCSVVHSILLYAAPVWESMMKVGRTRGKMTRIQRCAAIRVCSAYRTISYEAALVVAGIPPLDLMAKERLEVYEGVAKAEARDRLFERWQRRWEVADKGRWTRRLITNVRTWTERRHGEVGYYLTQALSGHGCFMEYLNDIDKIDSRECVYCGEVDNAEHTVFVCNRWREERRHGGAPLLSPDDMVERMLETEENWRKVEEAITHIMQKKEEDEREMGLTPWRTI